MDETRQQKQAARKKRVGRGVKYKRLPLLSAKREAQMPRYPMFVEGVMIEFLADSGASRSYV